MRVSVLNVPLLLGYLLGCADGGGDSATAGDTHDSDVYSDCEEGALHPCLLPVPCLSGELTTSTCPEGYVTVECSGWYQGDGAYFDEGLYCMTLEEYTAQVDACGGDFDCRTTVADDQTSFACEQVDHCE